MELKNPENSKKARARLSAMHRPTWARDSARRLPRHLIEANSGRRRIGLEVAHRPSARHEDALTSPRSTPVPILTESSRAPLLCCVATESWSPVSAPCASPSPWSHSALLTQVLSISSHPALKLSRKMPGRAAVVTAFRPAAACAR
jgi:hypothetical protein